MSVLLEVVDGIAEIRLNRPDKRNAINGDVLAELRRIVTGLPSDSSVRAVVLRGEGAAFCAGLDFSMIQSFAHQSAGGDRPFAELGKPGAQGLDPDVGQSLVMSLRRLPTPVIAAIQGPAIGAGFQLALGADIRIVGPDASLSAREVHYGLTMDMAGTQLLPRLVGSDRALEMMATGRFVGADEAVRIGLATSFHEDPAAAAFELARAIAERSPEVVVGSKALLRLAETSSLEEGLLGELQMLSWNMGRPNQLEAVAAAFEKRSAKFAPVSASELPAPLR
jgi:enoyl-CoA hydratase/carnithine racemase